MSQKVSISIADAVFAFIESKRKTEHISRSECIEEMLRKQVLMEGGGL